MGVSARSWIPDLKVILNPRRANTYYLVSPAWWQSGPCHTPPVSNR